jgi:hypothetical protein
MSFGASMACGEKVLSKCGCRSSNCPAASDDEGLRALRALRANRGFGADEMRIRTKTTFIDKSNSVAGLLANLCCNRPRSQIATYNARNKQCVPRGPALRFD